MGTAFFSFTRRPRDFLVVDVHDNIYFSPRDHEIFSWWVGVTIFLIFTMRPRDFLVVDVHDNIYFSPRDHKIFSWWVGVTTFYFFTRRPRDFLVVGVCDNILNINCETMRFSCGGCVGQPLLVFPRDRLYKLQCIIIL